MTERKIQVWSNIINAWLTANFNVLVNSNIYFLGLLKQNIYNKFQWLIFTSGDVYHNIRDEWKEIITENQNSVYNV